MSYRRRFLGVCVLGFGLACAGSGDQEETTPPSVEQIVEPQLRADLSALREHIAVPASVSAAKWTMQSNRAGGQELVAFFPDADTSAMGIEVSSTGADVPGPAGLLQVIGIDPDEDGALASCAPLQQDGWQCQGATVTLSGVVVYLTHP